MAERTSSGPDAGDRLVQLEDGDMHVAEDGKPGRPALLLIQNAAAPLACWDPFIPQLADAHRVIRVDLLGCGSPREQLQGVVPLDHLKSGGPQERVIGQGLGQALSILLEQRREVATEQDTLGAGELQHGSDRMRARGGELVAELPEVGLHPRWSTLSGTWHQARRNEVDAVGQVRDDASRVRDDQPQLRAAFERAAQDKVRHRPGVGEQDHAVPVTSTCRSMFVKESLTRQALLSRSPSIQWPFLNVLNLLKAGRL